MKCPNCAHEIPEPPIASPLRKVAKRMDLAYSTACDMAKRGEIPLLPSKGRILLVPTWWIDEQTRSNTGPTAA